LDSSLQEGSQFHRRKRRTGAGVGSDLSGWAVELTSQGGRMIDSEKALRFMRNMNWMISSGAEAEAMNRAELVDSLCEMDRFHISSLESAILSEAVFRIQHPMTWRLRRVWQRIEARYSVWKYLRRKKR
jgi:hypothetical protein